MPLRHSFLQESRSETIALLGRQSLFAHLWRGLFSVRRLSPERKMVEGDPAQSQLGWASEWKIEISARLCVELNFRMGHPSRH
jgi:hypothetical protein